MFIFFFFFFNDTATTEIYTTEDTLSLHDALPIYSARCTPRSISDNSLLSRLPYRRAPSRFRRRLHFDIPSRSDRRATPGSAAVDRPGCSARGRAPAAPLSRDGRAADRSE